MAARIVTAAASEAASAAASLDCNETGEVAVCSNWRSHPNGLDHFNDLDTDNQADNDATAPSTGSISYPQLKQPKHSKKRKFGIEETETARLTNAERDVLHVEIYKYFRWLKDALYDMETANAGKRMLGNACATSDSVAQALDVLESTFKVISPNIKEETLEDAPTSATASTPFLEKALGEHLSRMVEKAALRGGSHRREQGDFENYFQRLLLFKEQNGHSNVPVRYKDDLKLGKWISNIRQKKKSMEAEKLEETPTKTKRDRGGNIGAVTLTQERIERFEAIGFSWDLTGPTPRVSWEGRFQQMMEYHQAHHRWPPHSYGTLGEWVHKQRCKWAKKEKVFMEKHYPKLVEVGFLWKVKDRHTWEDRFQQLTEFGKANGHFHVPNPDFALDDVSDSATYDTRVEATSFYKWVESLHVEYEAFRSGNGSNILNDERVLQLVKLGFQFENRG